jgi:hypothetical protein
VGTDPEKSEDDYLQTMCDEGMKLSRQNGGKSIDVQRAMREFQKRMWKANEGIQEKEKKWSMHTPDNVHLNDMGQLAMAVAILKGLGAPAEVSTVKLDAKERKLVSSSGCAVTDVSGTTDHLEFTRLDEGLPLNAETFFGLNFGFIPIPELLNGYSLQITSLAAGDYDLIVDGRKVGTYSADQLGREVNISSATADPWQPGGPWDAQANILFTLTDSRSKAESSLSLARNHFPNASLTKDYAAEFQIANRQIEAMQRLIAKPRNYRFVVEKVKPKKAETSASR